MSKIVRVLKPGKLMGEDRKYGDLLSPAEYFSLPINIQTSLESSNHVEIDSEDGDSVDRGIEARVRVLEDRLTIIETGIRGDGDIVKITPQSKEDIIPSKGDTVTFMDKGIEVTGEVTSIVKKDKVARVKTDKDGKFVVSFEDIIN